MAKKKTYIKPPKKRDSSKVFSAKSKKEGGGPFPYAQVGNMLGNAVGGEAGSVLSAAGQGAALGTMIAPGVGTLVGGVLGAGISLIGGNKEQEQPRTIKMTQNPHGIFQYGGDFEKLNSTTIAADGATHEQGGIPFGNMEVENDETLDLAKQRVISTELKMMDGQVNEKKGVPLSKIHQGISRLVGKLEKRAEKSPSDTIIKNTLKATKAKEDTLYNKQEQYKAMKETTATMKYGGKYEMGGKMNNGGPIPKNQYGFYGDITPDLVNPLNETLNEDFSDPEVVGFYQQEIGLPVDKKLGPETYAALQNKYLSNTMTSKPPYGKTDTDLTDNIGVAAKNLLPPNSNGPIATVENQDQPTSQESSQESIGLTSGDKWQLLGSAIPAVANIGMGIFGKAHTQKPYTVNTPISLQQIDPQGTVNQIRQSTPKQFGRRSINVEQALGQNAASVEQGHISNAMSKIGMYNKQLVGNYEDRLFNRGRFNAGQELQADISTQQNKAAKQNLISTGISQAGQSLVNYGLAKNTQGMNNIIASVLKDIAPNYEYPDSWINMLMNGQIPPDMPKDQAAKFRKSAVGKTIKWQ